MRCSWGGSLNNFDGNSSVWNTSILWNKSIKKIPKKIYTELFAISWVFIKIVEYSNIYLLGHQMMKLILPAHNIPDSILPLNPPADSVLASSLPLISIYIPFAAGPRPIIPRPFFVETFICSSPGLLCIHPASQELTNHHGPQGYEKQCTWHFAGHFSWAKKCASLDVLSAFH